MHWWNDLWLKEGTYCFENTIDQRMVTILKTIKTSSLFYDEIHIFTFIVCKHTTNFYSCTLYILYVQGDQKKGIMGLYPLKWVIIVIFCCLMLPFGVKVCWIFENLSVNFSKQKCLSTGPHEYKFTSWTLNKPKKRSIQTVHSIWVKFMNRNQLRNSANSGHKL